MADITAKKAVNQFYIHAISHDFNPDAFAHQIGMVNPIVQLQFVRAAISLMENVGKEYTNENVPDSMREIYMYAVDMGFTTS